MPSPLRCYILRGPDGIWCGLHPYDTRAEAERARDDMRSEGFGVLEVVELCEVRGGACPSCDYWRFDDDRP